MNPPPRIIRQGLSAFTRAAIPAARASVASFMISPASASPIEKALCHCFRSNILDLASCQLQNRAAGCRVGLHALLGPAGYRPAAGERFHAAPVAAVAKRTVKVHRHVSDFPGCIAAPFEHPAAADDPSADSRPDKDTQQIAERPGRRRKAIRPTAQPERRLSPPREVAHSFSRSAPSGTLCQSRLGANMTPPVSGSTCPATPMPMPDSEIAGLPLELPDSFDDLVYHRAGAAPRCPCHSEACPSNRPSSSTAPRAILVPPRSIPISTFPDIHKHLQ